MQIGSDGLLPFDAISSFFRGEQLTWANLLMMVVGGVLIYLAIAKEYEPVLLIPIGMGAILANIPGAGMGLDLSQIMAGNILGRGYLAGIGMTIGAVFGRIAGEGAARHAHN